MNKLISDSLTTFYRALFSSRFYDVVTMQKTFTETCPWRNIVRWIFICHTSSFYLINI